MEQVGKDNRYREPEFWFIGLRWKHLVVISHYEAQMWLRGIMSWDKVDGAQLEILDAWACRVRIWLLEL